MKRIALSGVALIPVLLACIDSPLSDIELTDFDVVRGEFQVEKRFGNGSAVNVSAYFRDKNGFGVRIKNGSVTVNGVEMNFDGVMKRYEKDNLPVVADSAYTFVVTLTNDDTCMAAIRTPVAEFGIVEYPSTLTISGDTAVTWSDSAGRGTYMTITMTVDSDTDSSNLATTIFHRTIIDSGSFALTSDLFNPSQHTGNGSLKLTRAGTGTVSLKLRSGSSAASMFQWWRSVTLVP
ncbi:MAG: hypothetical protein JXA71_10655 [Chitinispirillaceae bacterium]|nr:hypothetical protein [Chitinispirillaceae bacterium]